MGRFLRLLLVASVLTLLVTLQAQAKKPDSGKETAMEHSDEEVEHSDEEVGGSNGNSEHSVEESEQEEHHHEEHEELHHDEHEEGDRHEEEKREGHDYNGEKNDEADTISTLVNLSEPPSSERNEGKLEDEHHTTASERHHDATGQEKADEKKNCCFVNLREPLSSPQCSCSQWLKHALRNSVFFRPLLDFVRSTLPDVPRSRRHQNEAHKAHRDGATEEEEQSEEQSDLRGLGIFNQGFLGGGYYGGYPGYWGGYPGYWGGYPGWGWGGGPEFGFNIYL